MHAKYPYTIKRSEFQIFKQEQVLARPSGGCGFHRTFLQHRVGAKLNALHFQFSTEDIFAIVPEKYKA